MNDLAWFIERIGKKVYRDRNICSCDYCQDIKVNGITIKDLNHAQYLLDIQNQFKIEYYEKNENKT